MGSLPTLIIFANFEEGTHETRCYDGKNGNMNLSMKEKDTVRKVLEQSVKLILLD